MLQPKSGQEPGDARAEAGNRGGKGTDDGVSGLAEAGEAVRGGAQTRGDVSSALTHPVAVSVPISTTSDRRPPGLILARSIERASPRAATAPATPGPAH